MSIAALKTDSPRQLGLRGGLSAAGILLVGVVVIPVALAIAANSWSTPSDADYVRMAFANVADATIAIASVVALLVHRITRRASASTIAGFSLIAIVVILWQISVIGVACELLLRRLAG